MTEPQRKPLFAGRLLAAFAVSLTATVACVAAATEPVGPTSADVHPLTAATPGPALGTPGATPLGEADSGAPGDGGKPEGGCPYGALEDPHRGFVRCLAQGEKSPVAPNAPNAPNAPGGGGGAESDAGADAGDGASPGNGASPGPAGSANAGAGGGAPAPSAAPSAAPAVPAPPPAPGPPPVVEIKTPKFENGDVPKAEKNLSGKKVLEAIAKCVADAGGLTAKTGSLKVEFLVRSRGKAEGVEVKPQGVSEEAARCVRNFLKNRSVGIPTADPTGVTVVYNLKPAGK